MVGSVGLSLVGADPGARAALDSYDGNPSGALGFSLVASSRFSARARVHRAAAAFACRRLSSDGGRRAHAPFSSNACLTSTCGAPSVRCCLFCGLVDASATRFQSKGTGFDSINLDQAFKRPPTTTNNVRRVAFIGYSPDEHLNPPHMVVSSHHMPTTTASMTTANGAAEQPEQQHPQQGEGSADGASSPNRKRARVAADDEVAAAAATTATAAATTSGGGGMKVLRDTLLDAAAVAELRDKVSGVVERVDRIVPLIRPSQPIARH